jgi:hypothetical protein
MGDSREGAEEGEGEGLDHIIDLLKRRARLFVAVVVVR